MTKYLLPVAGATPGVACGVYVIKDTTLIHTDLEKIFRLEKEFGGCRFWLVQAQEKHTGWHLTESWNVPSLRQDENGTDKVRHLIDQLDHYGSNEDVNRIRNECKSKPGKIVELVWNYAGKWTKPSESWGDNPHNRATE